MFWRVHAKQYETDITLKNTNRKKQNPPCNSKLFMQIIFKK